MRALYLTEPTDRSSRLSGLSRSVPCTTVGPSPPRFNTELHAEAGAVTDVELSKVAVRVAAEFSTALYVRDVCAPAYAGDRGEMECRG